MNTFTLNIGELFLELLPMRALWWNEGKALIVSDLHLGKASHFRKEGIYLPAEAEAGDLQHLDQLILQYNPERIWILGDFFHSEYNASWQQVVEWRKQNAAIEILLIKGNHDLLNEQYYEQVGIQLMPQLIVGEVVFSHAPVTFEGMFTVAGHIHPGIKMEMKARQNLYLPCFYLNEQVLLLPAFGKLTGLYSINPDKGSEVYAIAGGEMLRIKY